MNPKLKMGISSMINRKINYRRSISSIIILSLYLISILSIGFFYINSNSNEVDPINSSILPVLETGNREMEHNNRGDIAIQSITLEPDTIYRNQTVLIKVACEDSGGFPIEDSFSCNISHSLTQAEKDWTLLNTQYNTEDSTFRAVFNTDHNSVKGEHYFQAKVTNRTSGASQTSSISTLQVLNNPPRVFVNASGKRVVGEELKLTGEGSFDLDGNISSYRWKINGQSVNESGSKWPYKVKAEDEGDFSITLTVTDDEGASRSDTITMVIEKNTAIAGEVTKIEEGETQQSSIADKEVFKGGVNFQGHFIDKLGFNKITAVIKKASLADDPGAEKKMDINVTLTASERKGLRIWREINHSFDGMNTYWSFELDSEDISDGEYVLFITAESPGMSKSQSVTFKVDNVPPPKETHALAFMFIALGIFLIIGLITFLIVRKKKNNIRQKLLDIGYESKEVYKYVPLPSYICLFISLAGIIFASIALILMMSSWLWGILVLLILGLSGMFAFMVFTGRSFPLLIIGCLISIGTGFGYFFSMLDEYPWALTSLIILIFIAVLEMLCFLLFNRNYVLMFQNRVENTTSVGTNYTLNVFDLYRDHEAERKRNERMFGSSASFIASTMSAQVSLVSNMGLGGGRAPKGQKSPKGPAQPKGPSKPGAKKGPKGPSQPKGPAAPKGKQVPEWKKKIYRAYVFGKISYTKYTNDEVKIGVFDVDDWKADKKVAHILLGEFIKLMNKKEFDKKFASLVRIKLLTTDSNYRYKEGALKKRKFRPDEEKSTSNQKLFKLEIK